MYYTITNTIGTEITADGKTFVCGQCYATKTKAVKDADYLLAFSKAENPVNGLVWRFDGKADIDFTEFCRDHINKLPAKYTDDVATIDEIETGLIDVFNLAWKSERINIQAKIRPSKDSKKAVRAAEMQIDIADIEAKFAAGEIDAAEFGKLAIEITRKYN